MKLGAWVDAFMSAAKGNEKVVIELHGIGDGEIDSIADDSREVSPGSLFIARKGAQRDGHQFIGSAIQRGASAVVLEQPIPEDRESGPAAYVRVADSRAALSHLAPYFYGDPASALRLVGLTGTNGKTTTAYLIDAMLREAELHCGLLSSVIYRLGKEAVVPRNTTPGLLELQGCFAKMRKSKVTHVTMEVSSHSLHQGRVEGCTFETAVFTNLTEDHLDYHRTMEAYYAAKKKLFDQTKGRCVINGDDPWGKRLLKEVEAPCWSYGIARKGAIHPEWYRSDVNGIAMTVQTPAGKIDVASPLCGVHNIYNLLAAIGAGLSLGLGKSSIASAIRSMRSVPGRFEKIDEGQNFNVIVDYAHTEDALRRLLRAVSDLSPKRIITVFGCGGDRDKGKRPKMAAVAAAFSQVVILTSDNPRTERPEEIIREIETGFPRGDAESGERSHRFEKHLDRRKAIRRAVFLAEPGDAVVIAGKGHEAVQQIGNQRLPFDDRAEARRALTECRS
ncbi:MAG: UDP-N-acetylmuramoyl-L-alanyl-D-glutamate--2,6-diaminopimelate ligase [Nitrospiria bacterium]